MLYRELRMSEMNELINTALQDEMSCGILTNVHGDILILHDKDLKSELQWVEFDKETKKLSLVHEDGTPQDLGIALDDKTASNLSHGQAISLACVQNKKLTGVQNLTLVVQDY